jgi:hypothetical protein
MYKLKKLKTNVIYTYFNRKTLSENGLGSVLFNALNIPSTLSPIMRMVILQCQTQQD